MGCDELKIGGASWKLVDAAFEAYHAASTTSDWNFWCETTEPHGGPGAPITRFGFSGTVPRSLSRIDELVGAELELVEIEGNEATFEVEGVAGFLVAPMPDTGFRLRVANASTGTVTLEMDGPLLFYPQEPRAADAETQHVRMNVVARVVGVWRGRPQR